MLLRRSTSLTGLIAVLVLSGLTTALAEDTGTGIVNAQVTIPEDAEACILVPGGIRDFGTVPFGDESVVGSYTVTSCSHAEQDILVAATDATGNAGASWAVAASTGHNLFAASARTTAPHEGTEVQLGKLAQGFRTLYFDTDYFFVTHDLSTPLPGSDGAGQTMTFDIIWTATIADSSEPNCEVETCYLWWPDADGDGYGDMYADPIVTTDPTPPEGYVDNDWDCDDTNPEIHPGAEDVEGDGLDNNCDGIVT